MSKESVRDLRLTLIELAESGPLVLAAGFSLMSRWHEFTGSRDANVQALATRPDSGDKLMLALRDTLARLADDPYLVGLINSGHFQKGYDHELGPVVIFLAVVEAGHVLWSSSTNSTPRFTLRDYYTLPSDFPGDLKDLAGGLIAWSMQAENARS